MIYKSVVTLDYQTSCNNPLILLFNSFVVTVLFRLDFKNYEVYFIVIQIIYMEHKN